MRRCAGVVSQPEDQDRPVAGPEVHLRRDHVRGPHHGLLRPPHQQHVPGSDLQRGPAEEGRAGPSPDQSRLRAVGLRDVRQPGGQVAAPREPAHLRAAPQRGDRLPHQQGGEHLPDHPQTQCRQRVDACSSLQSSRFLQHQQHHGHCRGRSRGGRRRCSCRRNERLPAERDASRPHEEVPHPIQHDRLVRPLRAAPAGPRRPVLRGADPGVHSPECSHRGDQLIVRRAAEGTERPAEHVAGHGGHGRVPGDQPGARPQPLPRVFVGAPRLGISQVTVLVVRRSAAAEGTAQ
mmetsp:Transcript_10429/g.14364  ORF Transcript_10429/g.14364 Transcript_10429/m.14364 type:complete len:291 (-) Transcript_10429:672-1544(-)